MNCTFHYDGEIHSVCAPSLPKDRITPRRRHREERPLGRHGDILLQTIERGLTIEPKVRSNEQSVSLNDLEFAYAPVRDQVRDLRDIRN